MCDLLNSRSNDCDPLYTDICDSDKYPYPDIRKNIKDLWGNFKPHADTHFIQEFHKQLWQRYWEMFVGCYLLDQYELAPHNDEGPDFHFPLNEKKVWVEVIAPTCGMKDKNKVPDFEIGVVHTSQPRERIILRFTQAIYDKSKKFKEDVEKGIVETGDINIIAISSADVAGMWWTSDTDHYILRALFPFSDKVLYFNQKDGEYSHSEHQYRDEIQNKQGGAVKPVYFSTNAYDFISAVIYSDIKIHHNAMEDRASHIVVIHNPFARNPLPVGALKCAEEYVADVSEGNITIKNILAR